MIVRKRLMVAVVYSSTVGFIGCTNSRQKTQKLHVLDGQLVESPSADERAYTAYFRACLAMGGRNKNLDKARAHMIKALYYAPDDAHLWTILGQIELGLGHWQQAALAKRRALQLQPDYMPAHELAEKIRQRANQ